MWFSSIHGQEPSLSSVLQPLLILFLKNFDRTRLILPEFNLSSVSAAPEPVL